MKTVFHARPYARFTEIKSNFRRKKLYRTNNYLDAVFIMETM